MTFIKGASCELRVLQETPEEVNLFTDGIMRGLTTKHLFTGSIPMRYIDVKEGWEKERKSGAIQFGIWAPVEFIAVTLRDNKCTLCPLEVGIEHTHHQESRFIGTCGLYSHRDIYRGWEFRILIFTPDAIGHGIGTEATRLTVNYAFERLNAHRVWLGVNAENLGAIKCYEKVGFKEEGRLRDEIFTYGKYHDSIRMSVLENEWTSSSPA